MELKGKDTYRIVTSDVLSSSFLTSLISLYQPIMGHLSTILYLTLYSEGINQRNIENHNRLCDIMNINIMDLEVARKKLEEFHLLTTYYHSDNKFNYIYILHAPLSADSFFNNEILCSLLLKALNNRQFELTATKLLNDKVDLNGYDNISVKLANEQVQQKRIDELKINKVKPRYTFTMDETIDFDYDKFLRKVTNLIFPVECRTQENMGIIGKVATLNGISVDNMIIMVGNAISFDDDTFDVEGLKKMAVKYVNLKINVKNIYKSNPFAFLSYKQQGKEVTSVDRTLIEYLSYNMQFSNEVINTLIEFVLKTNENRLPYKYVEKIAGQWAREHITNREMAVAAINKISDNSKVKTKVLPTYVVNEKVDINSLDSDAKADYLKKREELIAKVSKELNDD